MKYSTGDIRALTTWQAAVLIPGLQAGVTGLIVGILGGTAAALAGGDPLKWGLLSGGLVGLWAWAAGISDWRSAIYQTANPQPMQPAAIETVRLEVLDLDTPQPWGHWLNLPIQPEAAQAALLSLAEGRDLSMGSLTGRGNPLSRTEFCALRDALINAGLAYWINPRSHSQGCALNVGGRAVLKRYARL